MKTINVILLVAIFIIKNDFVFAQNIISIAGDGTIHSSGDGGPATSAQVANPGFGCFDGAGNYYFGEGLSSTGVRIRRINPTGIIQTVAGNGITGFSGDGTPATSAKIGVPVSFVDAAGNIYISDYRYYRLRKVDASSGIIHTIAGTGTNSSTGNGGPAITATLVPIDVCTDGAGNIFVSDQAANSIRRIDAVTGMIKQIAATSAQGMCFDPAGHLYLGGGARVFKVDTASGNIDTIAGTGLTAYNGDEIPASSANFSVFDIARDTIGNIFIADYANHRVRMVDTFHIIHTIAGTGINGYGGDNGPATTAILSNPEGLAFDNCGNLYIAVNGNNRIRKVIFNPTCDLARLNTFNSSTSSSVLIYPNPAINEITITNKDIFEITIVNLMGQTVFCNRYNTTSVRLNLSNYSTGVYFINITDDKGNKTIRKFIKL
jgi:trimeric autotransporter adhesin